LWRDEALLLDMLLAAGDARRFVEGLDQAQFDASKLHQAAVARSSGSLTTRRGRSPASFATLTPISHGARSSACGTA
jgi:hypothetical protein